MKRLNKQNINSPEEYNRIFIEKEGSYEDFDFKRWKLMLKYFRGGRLIDLGCFDSLLPKMAKQKIPNSEIYAIDYADKVVRAMQSLYPEVKYMIGDVYNLPFEDEYFHYITAGELLEHLDNPFDFLKEVMRVLKPGGMFVLSTPLEETEKGEVDKDRHVWSYSITDFYQMLKDYGIIHYKILGSEKFPVYKYHFPIVVVFCQKNAKID